MRKIVLAVGLGLFVGWLVPQLFRGKENRSRTSDEEFFFGEKSVFSLSFRAFCSECQERSQPG